MNTRSIPQPSAATYSVLDLVGLAHSGRIRVPEFQRPLRWTWEDVRRLFDSIVRGYPIGSLLLWKHEAFKARVQLGALTIDAPNGNDALWVVDGQQRLTSLANALSDKGQTDERFALAYDLEKGSFVRPDPTRPHVVPLPVLFDLQRVLRWLREHEELSEHADDAAGVTRALREYKIPAYIVENDDEDVLRDIFDRMNNYGKRLSRAEIFAALHPASKSDDDASFARITEDIDTVLGFGRLDDDTVLRAVLARRGGDVARDIRDEFSQQTQKNRDFGGESTAEAYREGGIALAQAVRFLIESGVPHFAFLPYRYLLVVLTRFFAHFPNPHPRNIELLRRWLWRAALYGPTVFSGSWTEAMRVLATRIIPHFETESVQKLLEIPEGRMPTPNLNKFRANQADSKVALCAFWALEPRSPRTGQPYTRQDLGEALDGEGTAQVALKRFTKRAPTTLMSSRVFLLGRDAEFAPVDLFAQGIAQERGSLEAQRILQSHGLNADLQQKLAQGNLDEFIARRQILLKDMVTNFIRDRTASEFEDTPPLDTFDFDDPADDERDDEDESVG